VPALSVLPIVAALDQVEVDPDRVSAVVAAPGGGLSLVDALSTVPDPRRARGVRHGVLAVLTLSACAVLAGARSFAAIAEYAHDVGAVLLNALGLTDTAGSGSTAGAGGGVRVPHESTLRRVLQAIDPAGLEAALRAWTLAQLDTRPAPADIPVREQRRVLALDGKTLRGAHLPADDGEQNIGAGGPDAGVRRPHLVSVLDQASGTVLGQVAVDATGLGGRANPGGL
jgi:hypothetical protein